MPPVEGGLPKRGQFRKPLQVGLRTLTKQAKFFCVYFRAFAIANLTVLSTTQDSDALQWVVKLQYAGYADP